MSYEYEGYAYDDFYSTGSGDAVSGGESWSSFFQGLTKTVVSGYAAQESAAQNQEFTIARMQASNPAMAGDRVVRAVGGSNSMLLLMAFGGLALYLVLK